MNKKNIFAKLKKYSKIIYRVFIMSHSQASIYRLDYFLRIFRAMLDVLIAYIVISTFYTKAPVIAGWDKWEALLVYAFYQIISTLVYTFAGYGINNLPRDIIRGKLDQYLIKPLDGQFLASIQISFVTNVFRFSFGLAMFLIAFINLGLKLSPLQIILTIVSVISGVVIYYSILFIVNELAFWTFSRELGELMNSITSINRFPVDYFSKNIRTALYIIPLAFIATVPAKTVLDDACYLSLLSPLVAMASFFITRLIWFLGLRSYQSASS